MTNTEEKLNKNITLGFISSVFGVKGWVKIHSFTGVREDILKYKNWLLEKNGHSFQLKLEAGKKHGKSVIAKFEGYNDRDQAAKLIKANIVISRSALPDLPKGEYYWSDLEGLDVFNVENKLYGQVDHLFETGANDVMVVKGEKEILIPFIQGDYIKSVDLEAKRIVVDWPEEF